VNARRSTRAMWLAGALAIASLVHLATIYAIPRIVMARTLSRLGSLDEMHVGKRPDAGTRAIVRPSPDMLYAACPYDLARGALRVTAPVTHSSYWSIAGYDSATNNYFVEDDQAITSDSVEVFILRQGMPWPAADHALTRVILLAPADTGVVLIRTAIDDPAHFPRLAKLLHEARCGTVAPAAGLR